MALSLHTSCSSSLLPLLLQYQRNYPHNSLKILKLKTCFCCCCCSRSVRVNDAKTKRKLRPSFLEQVQDKWSVRQTSTRERLPWQEQKQEEEQEVEEEVEIDDASPSLSESVSFLPPSRLITTPWIHGSKTKKTHFDFELKKGENVARNGGLVEEEETIQKAVTCNIGFEEKLAIFDAVSGNLTRDEEVEVVKDVNESVLLNQVPDDWRSGSVELPWKREGGLGSVEEEERRRKRSNTELVERMLPEHELKRLRNVALRMLERIKVGASGVTQELVDAIHEKWKLDEVVKLKFEEPLSRNMRRTHEMLESRTGGLVIWRSGSSVVLYRGMTYKFECVQSYTRQNKACLDVFPQTEEEINDAKHDVKLKDRVVRSTESFVPEAARYLKDLSQEELNDFSELDHLLDELGPRFKDWSGREPLPVDADLLPPVVPGYKPPFRLLPHGVRHCLRNEEMTVFRRLARTMHPHFALGRNKELQGLAKAMVKLWERTAIVKIAIKRGVQNTRNERMAEELKRLTGGTLLSRNKEYVVFYRGNDFLPPAITETLKERKRITYLQQDEEEQAREMALDFNDTNVKTTNGPQVAGTLAETIAATSRWGKQPSSEDMEEMMRDSALARRASLIKHLENKLAYAKGRFKKAENAISKLQEDLRPADLPTDLETLNDEERFLFRKIGLSMKPYLLLGRRGVYDGTVENMHLHWKYRELVKVIVKRESFAQVKHIAISLEAESGGVLVSVDKTTKGYAVIVYRGKNYQRPRALRPTNLLTRRKALARSIELQRREALKHHISDLQERIELIKSELQEYEAGKKENVEKTLYSMLDDVPISDSEEDEGEEAYLEIYDSSDEESGNQHKNILETR